MSGPSRIFCGAAHIMNEKGVSSCSFLQDLRSRSVRLVRRPRRRYARVRMRGAGGGVRFADRGQSPAKNFRRPAACCACRRASASIPSARATRRRASAPVFFRGPRRISSAERSRSVPDAARLPRRGGGRSERRDGARVAAGGKVLARRTAKRLAKRAACSNRGCKNHILEHGERTGQPLRSSAILPSGGQSCPFIR